MPERSDPPPEGSGSSAAGSPEAGGSAEGRRGDAGSSPWDQPTTWLGHSEGLQRQPTRKFGPGSDSPPPGSPPPGSPPAAPPPYSQPPYGPPPYGSPPHGFPPYGPPSYGPPPYGSTPYGWPGPGAPGGRTTPAPRRNRKAVALGVALVVLLLAVVALVVWRALQRLEAAAAAPAPTGSAASAASSFPRPVPGDRSTSLRRPPPPATQEPAGLGTDQLSNNFAQLCYAGDMFICDLLGATSAPGTPYRSYADSCAGRRLPESRLTCRLAYGG